MILGISWVWWAISTFGLIGTGLMLWLAPAVLVQVVKSLLSFFLTNRYGNMIAVGAIVFFVADVNRSLRDEHEFAARTAAFEQEQKNRDARIAKETREEVLTQIANQTAANAATDQEAKEFTNALPKISQTGDNPFRVGADSCRLRHLAGQAGCGPQSIPRSVPATRPPVVRQPDRGGFRLPQFIRRGSGGNPQGQ